MGQARNLPLPIEGNQLMNVTSVSASVRFSKAIQPGCYKTIELSAEADVAPRENWQTAQSQLYTDLGEQLKALWSARNDQSGPAEQRNGDEDSRDTAQGHFCSEHQTPFKQYTKGESTWYAHKTGDSWCNEK